MISIFSNELITKNKLNALVDGINTNTDNITDIKTTLENLVILNGNVTKTVGTGGDFTTLNEAIDWCKTLIPREFKVTLTIKSGTILYDENISLYNTNLSFVTINMENDEILQIQLSSNSASYKYFINARNSITPYLNIKGIKYIGTYEGGGITLRNSKGTTGYLFNSIEFVESGIWLYENSELICEDKISIKQFSYQAVSVTDSKLSCDNFSSGISAVSNRINSTYLKPVFGIVNSYVDANLRQDFGESLYNSTTIITSNFKLFEIIRSKITYISAWQNMGSNMAKIITISEGSSVGYELLVGYSNYLNQQLEVKVYDCSNLYSKYLSGRTYEGSLRNCYLTSNSLSNVVVPILDAGVAEVLRGGIIRIDGYLNTPSTSQTANTLTANGIIFK